MAGNQIGNRIKIDTVIAQYMDEAEQSEHRRFRLFQLAVRGVEFLGLDFFYQVKTAMLAVNSNLTVSLPNDYVNYCKIGSFDSYGNASHFERNAGIATFSNSVSNYYDANAPYFYNYNTENGLGNYYYGGNYTTGSFNVDNSAGIISLSPSSTASHILLEYIASPEQDGDYYIPLQFREALIAWLAWKDIQNTASGRKGNISDKRDRKNEFYNQRRLAKMRYKPFIVSEALASSTNYLYHNR